MMTNLEKKENKNNSDQLQYLTYTVHFSIFSCAKKSLTITTAHLLGI